MRSFSQVDVFSAEPLLGNPVAVVHGADGLTDEQMAAFARWTNLSETTFLLAPTRPGAPTTGCGSSRRAASCRSPGTRRSAARTPGWRRVGSRSTDGELVQECGAGLVRLRRGERLAFAAPPLVRAGPVGDEDRARIVESLRHRRRRGRRHGLGRQRPGLGGGAARERASGARAASRTSWRSATSTSAWSGLHAGRATRTSRCARSARTWASARTRSPAASTPSIGQWLAGDRLPTSYVASQGTAIGRRGRVHIDLEGDTLWVGGDALDHRSPAASSL